MFTKIGRDEVAALADLHHAAGEDWPGLSDEYRTFMTKQLRAGFVFLSMMLWEPPNQFWDLPDYFLPNHRVLLNIARKAGLGILSVDEQADNWRLAIARVRKLVETMAHRVSGDSGTGYRGRGRRRHQRGRIIPVF